MSTRAGRSDVVRPARVARPDLLTGRSPARADSADRDRDRGPGRRRSVELADLLSPRSAPAASSTVVVGGGCAGLALGVAMADCGGAVTVAEARTDDRDGRTWCYWDTGESLLPEAASRSWLRWEIRTAAGRTVAADPEHPYRMVRAHDYRVAARARLRSAAAGSLLDGVRVVDRPTRTSLPADVAVFDARGAAPAGPAPAGRLVLHQRFLGRWVRAARPVFDPTTITLMDFADTAPGEDVRFHYVLPVAADLALVECTVFSRTPHGVEPFRQHVADYLEARWQLSPAEWSSEGEEAGSIPMTDAPPVRHGHLGTPLGLRAGAARPSTGYAFTRMHRAARAAAADLAAGRRPGRTRDPLRTRLLDAVFLRFLRDRPELAPAVFLRMFQRLPGPLTVRFLTERSSPLDDLRLVLALPKAPFLHAAAATAVERLRAHRP